MNANNGIGKASKVFKGVVTLLAILGAAFNSYAAPICTSGNSLSDYITEGGCTVEDKLFDSYTLSSSSTGGATALTTDDFTMLPEETPGNPGLSFVPGLRLSANAGQTQHLVIGFRVSLLSVENPNIEDASLALSGVSIQPGGAIIDMEALCLEGGPTCVPLTVSANSMTTEPGFMASTSFPSVTSINVTETIDLTGQADLQVITKRFSEVAEPSTWLLVVSSLGLLML